MEPLENLLQETISVNNIAESGVIFEAGTVNLITGEFISAGISMPSFFQYLIGSAMSPIVMPLQEVVKDKILLVDGGVRNVAPLKAAIDDGAEEIVCVVCHPEHLSPAGVEAKNLFSVVERLMDIVTNEIVNNDLEWATYINAFCPENGSPKQDEPFKGCRRVKVRLIRPSAELPIPLEDFGPDEIAEMIKIGKLTAKQA